MEALGIAVAVTESRLLRGPYGTADGEGVDQDLMFPVCGSTEPYYCHERRAVVNFKRAPQSKGELSMNRIFITAAATVLMTAGTVSAHARKLDQATTPTAKDAVSMLKLIDQQSADISDNAFLMNQAVDRTDDWEYQSDLLAQLRVTVNRVGRELSALEAERASLPQWEVAAVDQVVPAMHAVAMESDEAIRTFNADSGKLGASNYVIETDEISKDAGRAETLLRDDLKLENAKATAARPTSSADQQNTAGTQHSSHGAAE